MPHAPSWYSSTRPSYDVEPPTSRSGGEGADGGGGEGDVPWTQTSHDRTSPVPPSPSSNTVNVQLPAGCAPSVEASVPGVRHSVSCPHGRHGPSWPRSALAVRGFVAESMNRTVQVPGSSQLSSSPMRNRPSPAAGVSIFTPTMSPGQLCDHVMLMDTAVAGVGT